MRESLTGESSMHVLHMFSKNARRSCAMEGELGEIE